ncbi:uncharacterized protein LTR77_003056 [Saxophila tyrrhenica]|uniref:Ribosomal protein S2 n=1 Tax=Saxophila tyrrhenica TaxID=1690608 RepID=A0AAV9PGC5_9PEZI|nr:hypothetical protein LTR77_003056 [Saxophila tyrrhenica]
MIIRSLHLRHGRLALPKSSTPSGTLRRRAFTTTPLLRQQQQQSNVHSHAKTLPSEIRDYNDPVAQDFAFFHHQKAHTQHVGSSLAPHYRSHELVADPPRPQDITLQLLMASQSHIGHATSLWHPANAKYIFGVRGEHDPIHIISPDITAAYLRRACKIIRGVTSRGGLVLFVGTREGQARAVVRAAELSKGCHLFTKWIAGSITNGQQILGACAKKVVDENDKPIPGFGDQLPQTAALKPDLVVCLNPLENYILLHECGLHNIPTIGIVDTDVNPTWLTYPIPANDDSQRCVQVICGALGRAGEEGQKMRLGRARQGVVVSMPSHGLNPPTEGQAERDLELEERARLAEAAIQEELMIESEAAAAEHARQRRSLPNPEAQDADFAELAALEDGVSVDTSMLDRSLKRDQSDDEYDLEEDIVQSYQHDQALSREELAEVPLTADTTGSGEASSESMDEASRRDERG